MGIRSFRLKRLLAKAAKVHDKGELSDCEYGAFAVWVVERLRQNGAPIRPGALLSKELSWTRFPVEASTALKRRKEQWPHIDFQVSLDRYGPYNEAVVRLTTCLQGPPDQPVRKDFSVRWTDRADEFLGDAQFKLSGFNRIASGLERWMSDRRERLPHVLSVIGKLALLILTALLSFIVGRLTAG